MSSVHEIMPWVLDDPPSLALEMHNWDELIENLHFSGSPDVVSAPDQRPN